MKATETTILEFIGGLDKAFIIPPFQRNYEWSKEECTVLFNDIIQSCKTGKPHYLGNLTYYKGKNDGSSFTEIVLVDGQQRVTTVLILLCAIRDMIADSNKRESINRRYLLNESGDEIYRIRLKQTAYDSDSFTSLIDGRISSSTDNNVMRNYNLFKKLIFESNIDPVVIYEAIPKLEVVDVNLQITDDLEAVQKIFEKINSTGKPLEPSDLIRNLLLLTHSAQEQERLYKLYWIKIEEVLKIENISRFARDFIIMKIFNDVPEKHKYKLFKEYFRSTGNQNENVLSEMYSYSNFYAWILFETCPDSVLNRYIKMLNLLKTDDLYPLYLYLLYTLYSTDLSELRKIFKLLTDFMLRYRIVAPSGGGGALRSTIQELLENLIGNTIDLTKDAIHFELSNSATLPSRFPDDDEFKTSLKSNVNASYARVLLLKIEENETRNVPIDINEVTVEHLMPQTLSDWWKDYLGGEEDSENIYNEYLNSIGNLTLVSRSYNSTLSNKPWNDKLNNLRSVQFTISSEIATKYPTWYKDDIINRNDSLAIRATQAVTRPLKRTRPIRSKSKDDYIPGIYPISDTLTPMNGSTPVAIHYNEITIDCSRWKDVLVVISTELLCIDEQRFRKIVSDNLVHKATSTKNAPNKDPILSTNIALLIDAISISESGFYCEGCLSSNRARVYAKQLLELFNCVEDFSLEIS